MKSKNKVLLEYFRELVGSISINELIENEKLVQQTQSAMARLERLAI